MAGVVTSCEHCSARFEAPAASAGGITNCTACGLATSVPGGADDALVFFWLIALVVGAGVVAAAYVRGGISVAAVTALLFGVIVLFIFVSL